MSKPRPINLFTTMGTILICCVALSTLPHCAGRSILPASPSTSTTSTLTNTQQVYAQLGPALSSAASIYETTMIAAGQAHHDKLITDAQLRRITTAGEKAHTALTDAKSALVIYEQSHGVGSVGGVSVDVSGKFVIATLAVAEMVKEAKANKVIK